MVSHCLVILKDSSKVYSLKPNTSLLFPYLNLHTINYRYFYLIVADNQEQLLRLKEGYS